MPRLLLCLPLCFLLSPGVTRNAAPATESAIAYVADDGGALPTDSQMKSLAETDSIAFLEAGIRRYDREVKGYHCVLHKQERLDGKLQPSEEIDCQFREVPFSVLMDWREGARLAKKTLYVKGENREKMLVKPNGLLAIVGVVERDPDSEEARKSTRIPINEFGVKIGMEHTLGSWKKALKQDALHVDYLGEVKVKEVGDRVCWKLKRTHFKEPEDGDGVTELTIYVEKETWLQVGSTLKGADGQLLGEYFFHDIDLNPTFKPDTFTRETLGR